MHFLALFLKRYRYFKRDIRGLICELLLPAAIVLAGLSLMTIKFNLEAPPLLL
jgi:ATP-binding cassette subfamily A (ABC1) protein 3